MEVEMQQMEEQMGTPNRDRQRPASSRIASTLPRKPPSVLDSGLGEEVLDIVYPCTICMFFVIFLVQLLRLGEQGSDSTPSLGQAYYQEQVRTPTGRPTSPKRSLRCRQMLHVRRVLFTRCSPIDALADVKHQSLASIETLALSFETDPPGGTFSSWVACAQWRE
jgi:hypothetical protein